MGVIALVVALPVYSYLIKGQFQKITHAAPVSGLAKKTEMTRYWTDGAFWLIAVSLFIVAIVDGGMIQHTVLFLQVDRTIHYSIVMFAISAYHFASLLSRVLFGRVLDKYSYTGVIACYLLVGFSAFFGFFVVGVLTAFLFTLIRGLAHGALVICAPILAKHRYGNDQLGSLIGLLTALVTTGFAFGTFLMAWVHDATGSYNFAFVLSGIVTLTCGLALLAVKPLYWRKLQD